MADDRHPPGEARGDDHDRTADRQTARYLGDESMYRIEEGTTREIWESFDMGEFLRQLGVLP